MKRLTWWALRRAITDPASELKIIRRERLIQDLLSVRYKIAREKVIEIESKDDLRKRLGRSSDEADAVVIAHWMQMKRTLRPAVGEVDPSENQVQMVGILNRRPMSYGARRRSIWG